MSSRSDAPGTLVVVSGLPGVGKTTIAEELAARWGATHLSIDVVEDALLGSGLESGWALGVAAYESVRALTETNVNLGHDVVVDAVNDSDVARHTWREVQRATGAPLFSVHLVIGDRAAHERRLRTRRRGFAHLPEPNWLDVEERRARYEPWSDRVHEIDTTTLTPEQAASAILNVLGPASQHRDGSR